MIFTNIFLTVFKYLKIYYLFKNYMPYFKTIILEKKFELQMTFFLNQFFKKNLFEMVFLSLWFFINITHKNNY